MKKRFQIKCLNGWSISFSLIHCHRTPFKPLKTFLWCVIALWVHSNEDVNHYLSYLKIINASGKIRFTMQTENENGLELLVLKLELKGCDKITVDVYSNPTNSFTYVNLKTCYPSRNKNKILEGVALKLTCKCNSNMKYISGITLNH